MTVDTELIDTVIVGGGQSGLAVAHALRERAGSIAVLDRDDRVGDSWRHRWDSLRLFTPARQSALPGLECEAREPFATKDEVATYLERYRDTFELPVRGGVTVERIEVGRNGFVLTTTSGNIAAKNVVVATGWNSLPAVPEFANALDASIVQIHASDYRNPASLPEGPILVVGSGTSGVQIAVELAATRPVTIAGRPTAHIPAALLRRFGGLYWWFISNVLTKSTPIGRKASIGFLDRGTPLIGISVDELDAAGVTRVGRVDGALGGAPVVSGASIGPFAGIVWATGYRADFGWIDRLVVDRHGWPVTTRGVVTSVPGLYFVGMPFQYSLTSGLLGGVGRDAKYVASRIVDVDRP